MKKMRASVSPVSFLSGIVPVVTAYLTSFPPMRASWRVTTGGSSLSGSFSAFSALSAGDGEGDGEGEGAWGAKRRNATRRLVIPESLHPRLLEDVGRHLTEVLHDQAAPGVRPAQVLDVLVERLSQLRVVLAHAVSEARGGTEKQAQL